jgi:leader peptidase (prepilin peptidase)/N-methyltransferase
VHVVLAAVVGLCIGSFLNVVVHRVPRKESVVSPPSRCPGCETPIGARDNVPVLSWLLLRGRCRTCGISISPRYPLVESGTAILFAAVAASAGPHAHLPAMLVFAASLLAVALIDLEHFIVPNKILKVAVALGVPLLVGAAAIDDRWGDLGRAALGAVVGLGLLLLIHLANPRGMGMGDVKLAGVIGLYLGYEGVRVALYGLFLGFLLGSVVGVFLIATKLRSRKDHIPFAPYLAGGAVLAIFTAREFFAWYLP